MCKQITTPYEYIVYTNKGLKSIIQKKEATVLLDGNHITYIQKPIKSKPFFPSILLQDCINHHPWYYLINKSEPETVIDLQTDSYNFFVTGNVFNTCILKYIILKHYTYITLTPNYSIKVLTATYNYHTYETDFSIVLQEE